MANLLDLFIRNQHQQGYTIREIYHTLQTMTSTSCPSSKSVHCSKAYISEVILQQYHQEVYTFDI